MSKKIEVLILEDDPLRMVVFRERLAQSGREHTITHFEQAPEAVKALAANTYDLILLDHDLGGRTYVDHSDPKEDCGMRVAEYFMIRPEQIRKHGPIVVHSLNGPAAQQMVELIGEAIWCPFVWQREIWSKCINLTHTNNKGA